MSGPAVDIHVSEAVIAAKPKPWDLSTPQSAVRSYLDWITYAYRTSDSEAAKGVMDSKELVRVDAYTQYNVEQQRLLDQKLVSITFGTVSTSGATATVSAKESWTYSYLSIAKGNPVVSGPFNVDYDTIYTVVKSKDGLWRVAKVKATPHGTVK